VSIALGVYNLVTTKQLRSGTITIEELRSQVRDPIQNKLDALLEARTSFATLAKPNALKIDELRSKVSDVVSQVEFLLLDLAGLLQLADSSTFATGTDWETTFRDRCDAVQKQADKLAEPKATFVDIGSGLGAIVIRIETLDRDLRKRLEAEVRRHLPD